MLVCTRSLLVFQLHLFYLDTVTPIQSVYIATLCWLSLSVHSTYGAAIQGSTEHSLTDARFESTGRNKRSTGTLSPCFVIDSEAPVTPAEFPNSLKDLLNRVAGLQTSTSNLIQYVSTTSTLVLLYCYSFYQLQSFTFQHSNSV